MLALIGVMSHDKQNQKSRFTECPENMIDLENIAQAEYENMLTMAMPRRQKTAQAIRKESLFGANLFDNSH